MFMELVNGYVKCLFSMLNEEIEDVAVFFFPSVKCH